MKKWLQSLLRGDRQTAHYVCIECGYPATKTARLSVILPAMYDEYCKRCKAQRVFLKKAS